MSELIYLTQGKVSRVSPHRFEELNRFKWHACKRGRDFYAARWVPEATGRRLLLMHRLILGLIPGDGINGDHINHDTLDNSDENLRVATPTQSTINRRKAITNKTGFKGVRRRSYKGKASYRAEIRTGGRVKYLGCRKTAEQAYRELYVPAAIKYHGEFACIE